MSAHLEPEPEAPSLGRRFGVALLALVMFPIAGIPVVAGIAAESAAIAGVTGWAFRTVMVVQLAPLVVFAAGALVYVVVSAFRDPDRWTS